jgi:hypothetical protein
MISNGKTLKYKVLDIVESYNFHIWFISVRAQNSYHFEKKEKKNVKKEKNPGRTQAAASTPGSSARRIPRAATAVRRGPPRLRRQPAAPRGSLPCYPQNPRGLSLLSVLYFEQVALSYHSSQLLMRELVPLDWC